MHATAVLPAAEAPVPINRPTVTLTPRGHTVVAINRLEDQIRALDSEEDRGYALGMLHAVLRNLMALDATV
jgi:hypothetical protein